MDRKEIKQLKRGDVVQLASGECATVQKVYRETLFEGDVWTVVHSQGEDTANGGAMVALAPAT